MRVNCQKRTVKNTLSGVEVSKPDYITDYILAKTGAHVWLDVILPNLSTENKKKSGAVSSLQNFSPELALQILMFSSIKLQVKN